MTIRTRLVASVSLLLALSLGVLGYGVVMMSSSFTRTDATARLGVLVNSVERAAQDALLQKDDLLVISYIKFLQAQYPCLIYAKMEWRTGDRARPLMVGMAVARAGITETLVQVSDPADPSHRVKIAVGIDENMLYAIVAETAARLEKVILAVSGSTLLIGLLFAYGFARSVTAPIEQLSKLALEISKGKLGGKLEWNSDDELGALVKVFNAMSARLEDLDQAKKDFVSSVTHELRSPLGAIDSFMHLIRDRVKDGSPAAMAQMQEYLTRIQVNVQRLGGFINDLLDVAKIEKGKMECVLKPMRVQDVALEVCQFFEAKAKQQGVALSNELSSGLPSVYGDSDRLRQVLVNLVSNSLKFTPSGGRVMIKGEQFREGANRWLEIAVSDTGRGLASGDADKLFKAFSQGRNVGDGVIGSKGTGLGLYIVKSIVEQHGGRVDVKSAPGQGTEFIFSVKVSAA